VDGSRAKHKRGRVDMSGYRCARRRRMRQPRMGILAALPLYSALSALI
jgi:hypothetical protein